ncbi:hypothetical protein L6270_02740 [Candidatus Parcubacteria bacterium]|nr:hypothetical protein [Patescibacteria group bacterium]MBU4309942.1 hypothetical protein [Patescibacteria group bacterium]MBU4432252.1 hypothetical protein [Patescibacteria group bacterium]MBU4577867.1 hypothetical protein [Patescibacteria group bacterium]MCG2696928.1 hypothetical protein [Candidatus Parcubacteria bacterium]
MRKVQILWVAIFCLSVSGLAWAEINGASLRITGYKAGETTISEETKKSLHKTVADLDKSLLSVKDQSKLSLTVAGAADDNDKNDSSLGRVRANGVIFVLKSLYPQAKISVVPSSGTDIKPGEVLVWSKLETAQAGMITSAPAKIAVVKKESVKVEQPKMESGPVIKQPTRSNSQETSWFNVQLVASALTFVGLLGVILFVYKKIPKRPDVVSKGTEEEVSDSGKMGEEPNVLDAIIKPATMVPAVEVVVEKIEEKSAPVLVANSLAEIIEVDVPGFIVKIEKLLHDNIVRLESPFTTLTLGVDKMIPKTLLFDDTPKGMEELKTSLKKCLNSVQYSGQKDDLLRAEVVRKSLPAASVKTSKSLHVVGAKAAEPAVAAQKVGG